MDNLPKNYIDINFDFTTDTSRYWDDFWNNNKGLGAGNSDPDMCSKTLQKYHHYGRRQRRACCMLR